MKFSALRSLIINHLSFIILILLSTFYFLSSAALTNAISQASPTQSVNYPSPNTNSDVPNNLHNWTQSVMIEVMSSLTCQIAGVDPINPKRSCLGADQKTGKIGFLPSPQTGLPAGASAQAGGAIGFMGNMISVLYTPPLHTRDYFQNLAQNFGITKHAFAQQTGTGFQSLSPLINIWSAFRNIVYLLLVIVFVVIGLAIMLRVKIDPRTVMTIQNQIPKIIVGILAVTFSFAIAGFLIDMMWVLIYLFYGIFTTIPNVDVSRLNPSAIQGQNAIGVASHITSGGIFGIANQAAISVTTIIHGLLNIDGFSPHSFNPFSIITSDLIDGTKRTGIANWFIDLLSSATAFGAWHKIGTGAFPYNVVAMKAAGAVLSAIPFVGEMFKSGSEIAADTVKSTLAIGVGETTYVAMQGLLRNGLPYIIAYLIIIITVLVALFRLWFSLIMAYVQILLAVVLAPFWIIGGIVPGSPISIGGWFRSIGANLLAFPVTIAMFMLGRIFIDVFGKTPTQRQFVPPLIGDPGTESLIGSLIGLGIILMTPNVVTVLKAALKAPKTDTGIGKAIGAGPALAINTGKNIAGTFMSSDEAIMKKNNAGDYEWGERGIPKSIIGRFLGR